MDNLMMPHCDGSILHAPGVCPYCDLHPDWQAYRANAGIAFSGEEPSDAVAPCPSTWFRTPATRDQWYGNAARAPYLIQGQP